MNMHAAEPMRGARLSIALAASALLLVLLFAAQVSAQTPGEATGASPAAPTLSEIAGPTIGLVERDGLSTGVKLVLFFTGLSLLPALVVSVTCFTRVVVVLSLLRQAVGVQQPPGMVITALALMLSIFIMTPTLSTIHQESIGPYLKGQITEEEALERGSGPLRKFMLSETRQKDLALFLQIGRRERPATPDDLPFEVMVPAFMVSELRTAFEMGFMLFLPFLVVDMVVASVLMSMGMMMLPPVVVSLPFKIMVFVLVDGWHLVVQGLVRSFV
jgi:flagellar biosynthetic protein FliP